MAFLLGLGLPAMAQPPNDDCSNATQIPISGGGWDFGLFISDSVDLSNATTQTLSGEYINPQSPKDKSVWFKFTLPTTRSVAITPLEPQGVNILKPTNAGWTLYRTQSCFPGQAEVVDPPIIDMSSWTHQCLEKGEYLLQVTSRNIIPAPPQEWVKVSLDIRPSSTNEVEYDFASSPYNFGIASGISLSPARLDHFFDVGCQSTNDGEAACPDTSFSKSTWHTFTTDAVVNFMRFEVREDPWDDGDSILPRRFGYTLYEGNAVADSTPDNGPGLTTVTPCKTLTQSDEDEFAAEIYSCDLKPNTTYSIKLSYPTGYGNRINTRIFETGASPAEAHDPTNIPPAHQIDTLPFGETWLEDWMDCQSRIGQNPTCGPMTPPSGKVEFQGDSFELAHYSTFFLENDAHLNFESFVPSFTDWPLIRIFEGDASSGCGSLTLFDQFIRRKNINCFPAGHYTVQVLGFIDTATAHRSRSDGHMSKEVRLRIRNSQVDAQSFGLHSPGEIDVFNGDNPIPADGSTYSSTSDVFDCRTTPLPAGDHCGSTNNRGIFRRIRISQDGILTVGGGNWRYFRYRLYRGDASAEPIIGNEIQNLTDQAGCQSTRWPFKVCVTPGIYTLVSFGDSNDITRTDQPWVRFESFPATSFTDPLNPEILDTLQDGNTSTSSAGFRYNCYDNPQDITVGGTTYSPCNGATKQTYHEFYLGRDARVRFNTNHNRYQTIEGSSRYNIFRGRRSQGTLTAAHSVCTNGFNPSSCNINMDSGWYTVVSYGFSGETFSSPEYSSGRGGVIGNTADFTFSILPELNQPRFDSLAHPDTSLLVSPVDWGPSGSHTAQYPDLGKNYSFETEYFDCQDNLPFESGISACPSGHNRVAYRVFELARPSFVLLHNLDPWPRDYRSILYEGDLRSQSPPFTVTHVCQEDRMRLCNLQAGIYTLVTFADNSAISRSQTPQIYVDSVATTRFDHAAEAYDFGNVPNDDTEYFSKIGAPNGPASQVPSTTFIACDAGAEVSDPDPSCHGIAGSNPPLPTPPDDYDPRRNVWYTFEVTGPGTITVSGYNRTPGTGRPLMTLYELNDTTFTVIDSVADSLTQRAQNRNFFCSRSTSMSYFIEPCGPVISRRFAVLVDKEDGFNNEPNYQFDLGIRFTPITTASVKFDHFSQASSINLDSFQDCSGSPTAFDSLEAGTYTGCQASLKCATKDPTDQNTCGEKTVWYKFRTSGSGTLRANFTGVQTGTGYNSNDLMLFRSLVPGDSTNSGLVHIPMSSLNWDNPELAGGTQTWGQACIQPGDYYLMITGCANDTQLVAPNLYLDYTRGDLCGQPIEMDVTSNGTFSDSVIVDCWSIGEAPGENGTNMGCLGDPTQRKTGWFKLNLNYTGKKDIDIEFEEQTNVLGSDIKYRIASGDCDFMTFDNCVDEGIFIILSLKCREGQGPGDHIWIQVSMPNNTMGQIKLNATLQDVPDTACKPPDPEKPRADFDFDASCADQAVQFQNFSTTGPDVTYEWDFGDGFVSTAENPVHQFPQPDTFTVTLVVDNSLKKDTIVRFVPVYQRPSTFFTMNPGEPLFPGDSIGFSNLSTDTTDNLTSYFWNFCAGGCGASQSTYIGKNPPNIAYNSPGGKTVCLTVTNGNCDSTFCRSFFVSPDGIFSGGPYNGDGAASLTDSCVVPFFNIYAGGPYDGHQRGFATDSCATFDVNIFAGGPYDGQENAFATDSCATFAINIYAGGPYDGTQAVYLTDTCTSTEMNVFAGGPYDGHQTVFLSDSCGTFDINPFAGGPHDGAASVLLSDSCVVPELNIFAGGPYDGNDLFEFYCDTIPDTDTTPPPPPPSMFSGGPYDGHQVAFATDSCVPSFPDIWAGGPYDGHQQVFMTDSCDDTGIDIFSGGPFDGNSSVALSDSCNSFDINLFAGGPYDGSQSATLTDTCSSFFINLYAGGPFDGHSSASLSDSCSDFEINLFAGGPFDGHSQERYAKELTGTFTAAGDTICTGETAQITGSQATNWFALSESGAFVTLATNTATLDTTISKPGTYTFLADNPFSCRKESATVVVFPPNPTPKFQAKSSCATQTTSFTNETTVPGNTQASIGPSGSDISGLSSIGVPPAPGRISFSSGSVVSYANLFNGINDQDDGWRGSNSSAPATHWIQWNYLTPKSVNRITYMPRTECCGEKAPTESRLYYSDGMNWVLVKTFRPDNPADTFDSGKFFEAAGTFAQRWKLEMDVEVTDAPQLGEFQLYADEPVVGGNTLWSFGDGNTSTQQNPVHAYNFPGTTANFSVTLEVDVPGFLCKQATTKNILVDYCTVPLPLTAQELRGRAQTDHALLNWRVSGTFLSGVLQRQVGQEWVEVQSFKATHTNANTTVTYSFRDFEALLSETNYYRIRFRDTDNSFKYSNIARVEFAKPGQWEAFLTPNPANDFAQLTLHLPEKQGVQWQLLSLTGQQVIAPRHHAGQQGENTLTFNTATLAQGVYFLRITSGEQRLTKKLVVRH